MITLALYIRVMKELKVKLVVVLIYSIILTIYCLNPFVINPFEFTLYTKYFIAIGFVIWLLFSIRLHFLLINATPRDWLSINRLVKWPIGIPLKNISITLLIFITFQILIGITIAILNTVTFASGIELLFIIFKLYFIHYFVPFLNAWLIGCFYSSVYSFYSSKKAILFLCVVMVWTAFIVIFDYKTNLINLFNLFHFNLIINKA